MQQPAERKVAGAPPNRTNVPAAGRGPFVGAVKETRVWNGFCAGLVSSAMVTTLGPLSQLAVRVKAVAVTAETAN